MSFRSRPGWSRSSCNSPMKIRKRRSSRSTLPSENSVISRKSSCVSATRQLRPKLRWQARSWKLKKSTPSWFAHIVRTAAGPGIGTERFPEFPSPRWSVRTVATPQKPPTDRNARSSRSGLPKPILSPNEEWKNNEVRPSSVLLRS